MKKYLLILFFINFLFFIPNSILAEEYPAAISGDSVRIRDKATTTDSKIIFTVNSSTEVIVNDKTTISGSGCTNGWLKITYKEKVGYVCSKYVKYIDNSFSDINVVNWTSRVNANDVAVRKEADADSAKQNTLTLGVNVNILEEVNGKTKSCSSGKWYKIQYYGNKTGYICKSYVTKKESITENNNEYAQTLKDAGFTDSYIPYLTYLHSKYPNWKFVAKDTKQKFNIAVSSEEGKCYMQTTNDNYRTSTTPAEASNWFHVNSKVIAFYMDPRNWLSEERIFMFEKLDYTEEFESIYPTLVKSIFGSGKLGNDEYTIPMINAGKTNKISPVAIASRIRLEVGPNGSDSTNGCEFTFKGQKYSGYYNFFNIGAYEEKIDGVQYGSITRGLAYAAKLIKRDGEIWNNIQTAITEGSSFLANGYINKGQGTVYYQKFNVSPDAYYSSFTHQYMTNIQAPATEGNKSYNSYKDAEILNEAFIFEIPIYQNMPEYTSLPNSGNTNNYLKSLSIDGKYLTPSFDKDILTYEVYVPKDTEKIIINAESESEYSTVTGTGEIELPSDETDITIIVTSQALEERKYVISINKVDDTTTCEQAVSASSFAISNDYITKINNNTTVEKFTSTLTQNGAKNVVIKDTKGVQVTSSSLIGTGYSITIVTGMEEKTYTSVVKGDTSGDGQITILDLLQVQKHLKNITKLSNERLEAADTSGDNQSTILDLLQIQKHLKGIKSL